MNRIDYHGTREQLVEKLRGFVHAVTGHGPSSDPNLIGVSEAIGMAALSDIKADYLVKARGGRGQDGVQWAPLAQSTIENRLRRFKKSGGFDKHKSKIKGKIQAGLFAKYLQSMPEAEAKKKAKSAAEIMAKHETTMAFLDNLEILRDTGVMFNSLSPGQTGSETKFEVGQITLGTNVPYAKFHQTGTKRMPARPFLPEPEQIPDVWWQNWLDAGVIATEAALRRWLQA